jgi:hypothetical protein
MKIGIYYFHTDPNCYFQVKDLVNNRLNDICQNEIFNHEPMMSYKSDWIFSINVTVLSQQRKLLASSQPTIDKKNKFECHTILLPPEFITDTKDYPLNKYIEFFFEGLFSLLSTYGIEISKVKKCKRLAQKEILNNGIYKLTKEERFTEKMSEEKSIELEQELMNFLHKRR